MFGEGVDPPHDDGNGGAGCDGIGIRPYAPSLCRGGRYLADPPPRSALRRPGHDTIAAYLCWALILGKGVEDSVSSSSVLVPRADVHAYRPRYIVATVLVVRRLPEAGEGCPASHHPPGNRFVRRGPSQADIRDG